MSLREGDLLPPNFLAVVGVMRIKSSSDESSSHKTAWERMLLPPAMRIAGVMDPPGDLEESGLSFDGEAEKGFWLYILMLALLEGTLPVLDPACIDDRRARGLGSEADWGFIDSDFRRRKVGVTVVLRVT